MQREPLMTGLKSPMQLLYLVSLKKKIKSELDGKDGALPIRCVLAMLNALDDASAASAPARRGFAFTAVFLISACSHVPARAGLPTGTGPLSHHPATSA